VKRYLAGEVHRLLFFLLKEGLLHLLSLFSVPVVGRVGALRVGLDATRTTTVNDIHD
jgi:hypothetical protein